MDHQVFAQLLGNYGEFVGAVAVMFTLGYLAIQIRQSNKISLFNATRELVESSNEVNRLVMANGTIRQLLVKTEDLSDDEREQLFRFALMLANSWVAFQTAFDNGQITAGTYDAGLRDVSIAMERWPNFREFAVEAASYYPANSEMPIFEELFKQQA